MKIRTILGLLLFVGLWSCDNEEKLEELTVVDLAIDLRIQDADGVNLLEGEQAFTTADFKVYNHTADGWQISTNNLLIIEREGESCLRFFASEEELADNMSEAKLVLSGTEQGIFKTELNKTGSNLIITSLWYNEVLLWDVTDSGDRFFTFTIQ